ncbi:MAG: DHA2 family efflux MFS transporter permease subunit [Dehalococcoidales bacterium]|nr:DHA2 family efflux MFS transporter permease subunit [Dehalococcoidales bacterium]
MDEDSTIGIPGPPQADERRQAAGRAVNKWHVLAIVGLGTYLTVLDSSIVNVSLPVMTAELATDVTTVQWVIMAYLLTITGLLLTFGRLADLLGRKRVYMAGMAVFTLGMALCGLAQNVEQLIGLRVVQGIGAASVMALGPALTAAAFPANERGKALGINSTIVALGAISGPVLGGMLADLVDWRSVFLFRVPLTLLATILSLRVLADDGSGKRQRFDLLGGALLFVWLAALTLGLNQGRNIGWTSPTILALFATALGGFAAFVLVEMRVRQPMLELAVFRIRLFSAASVSALIIFMGHYAVVFLMPFYLVQGLGYPPSLAGIMILPWPLTMSVVAPISGWASDRIGSRVLSTAGIGMVSLGLFALSTLRADSTYLEIAVRLAMVGFGMGLFGSPNNNALLSSLPPTKIGTASGMLATMRNMGTVMGTAVAGAVWTARMAFFEDQLARTRGLAGQELAVQSLVGGIQSAFFVAALICVIGIFTSLVRGTPAGAGSPRRTRRAS